MNPFLIIITAIIAGEIGYWLMAHRALETRRARILLGIFMGYQVAGLIFIMLSRTSLLDFTLPRSVIAALYLWNVIGLPLSLLILTAARFANFILHRARGRVQPVAAPVTVPDAPSETMPLQQSPRFSRRTLLASAVAAAPLLNAGLLAESMYQLGRFRIRRTVLQIPQLPKALNGMTIAHVTDMHIGRFTTPDLLRRVAETTNRLNEDGSAPDLVFFTGDLIDFDLDDLPAGMEMLARMRPKAGLFVVEGNHDLFEDRNAFERRMLAAGMPLLLNSAHTLDIHGHPLQILGMKWGSATPHRDPAVLSHADATLALRDPTAFPILLAHHPHAFDAAIAAGIPLTLGGHTHGGQVMLTKNIGPGPLLYRYWSGLYTKGPCSTFISNGVGNWFPLRINAPAEIVHLTLVGNA